MHYTLEQFDSEGLYSYPSLDEAGNLMTFPTWDDAVGMARFIVEDPSEFPLVGIIEENVVADEETGHSAGWAQREPDGSVTVHEGCYENDPDWDALRDF